MNSTIVFIVKVVLLIAVIIGLNTENFMNQYVFFHQLFAASYTFLSTSIVISIFRIVILFIYNKRKKIRKNTVSNFHLGVNQLSTILNVTFFVIAIFVLLGIDVKEFLTSITLVAMAIALLFREYITNMISGLIIMFSDKFEVTDYIKIGEHSGRIENMTLQNTLLKNEDGDSVLIPNNAFFTSNIINKSIDNKGSFTIDFQLPFEANNNHDFIENEINIFIKEYTEIYHIKSCKLSINKVTFEYIQYKIILEYEYQYALNFSKIKSDFLKNILHKLYTYDPKN